MRRYIAESIGTFILVFCGTGAIVIDQEMHGVITHPGIAIVFGLVVTTLIFALGDISGAHFNPAVTIAFTLAREFDISELPLYILSQVAGGMLASFVLHFLFPANTLLGATLPAGTDLQSWILEFILTFFLMLVILMVAKGSQEKGMFAALAIGAVVLLEAMFAGPVCGASMNPIRSLAPAVISGHMDHLWIYLTATIAGAAIAVPVWHYLKSENPQQ